MSTLHPTAENLSSIPQLFDYTNTVGDGLFYVLFLVSFWLVLFMWLKGKRYMTGDAVLASSFSTLIIGTLLFVFGGLDDRALLIIVVVLGLSALWGYWYNRQ